MTSEASRRSGADAAIVGGRVIDGTSVSVRDLHVVDGRIAAPRAGGPAPATTIDARDCLVGPGLVDLQVNGATDVDLTVHPERWPEVALALVMAGTTTFCPTVVTATPETMLGSLVELTAARRADHPLASMIAGVHMEGPFLAPSRAGAHDTSSIRSIDTNEIGRWLAQGPPAIVTLAPEMQGALDAIGTLVEAGVVVSIGHSDATSDTVEAAIDAGALAVTHLFNAMSPLHHREPGVVGAALSDDRTSVSLIADGHHLDRRALTLAWSVLGPKRRMLISDATAATLGAQPVSMEQGVPRTSEGVLAGSSISLLDAVQWCVAHDIGSLDDVWRAASLTPARLLGRDDIGHLGPGARADIVILEPDGAVRATLLGGRPVSRTPLS